MYPGENKVLQKRLLAPRGTPVDVVKTLLEDEILAGVVEGVTYGLVDLPTEANPIARLVTDVIMPGPPIGRAGTVVDLFRRTRKAFRQPAKEIEAPDILPVHEPHGPRIHAAQATVAGKPLVITFLGTAKDRTVDFSYAGEHVVDRGPFTETAGEVLDTVHATMIKYIKQHRPDTLSYTASMPRSAQPNIYAKLADRIGQNFNAKVTRPDKADGLFEIDFTKPWVKNPPVRYPKPATLPGYEAHQIGNATSYVGHAPGVGNVVVGGVTHEGVGNLGMATTVPDLEAAADEAVRVVKALGLRTVRVGARNEEVLREAVGKLGGSVTRADGDVFVWHVH